MTSLTGYFKSNDISNRTFCNDGNVSLCAVQYGRQSYLDYQDQLGPECLKCDQSELGCAVNEIFKAIVSKMQNISVIIFMLILLKL